MGKPHSACAVQHSYRRGSKVLKLNCIYWKWIWNDINTCSSSSLPLDDPAGGADHKSLLQQFIASYPGHVGRCLGTRLHNLVFAYNLNINWFFYPPHQESIWILGKMVSYSITNLMCLVAHHCFQYLPFSVVDSPSLSEASFTQSLQTNTLRVKREKKTRREIESLLCLMWHSFSMGLIYTFVENEKVGFLWS